MDAPDLVVETKRLFLRRWRASDEAPGGPERLAWLMSTDARLGYTHWPIVERSSGTIVGTCGFRSSSAPHELEIGFALFEPFRKRGYATEAVAAVARYGIERLASSRILSLTARDNVPARRVLERAGFVHREDAEVDGEQWSIFVLEPSPH